MMGKERKRATFKLDLAMVSRGGVAFGEIGGKGVFVSVTKVGEILKEVNDHKGMVWVEADLVPNPQKEKRGKTPYALLSSGEIYSVAKGKKPDTEVVARPEPTKGPELSPTPEQAEDQLEQSEPFIDPDGFTPEAMIDIPGGKMHGTLVGLVGFIVEAVGEIEVSDDDVKMATAILALKHGCDRDKLEAEVHRQIGRVNGMRMGAVCNRVLELMPELIRAAEQAPTVADVTITDHPEAVATLAEFLGIQGQGDVASLALVEDTASNSAT